MRPLRLSGAGALGYLPMIVRHSPCLFSSSSPCLRAIAILLVGTDSKRDDTARLYATGGLRVGAKNWYRRIAGGRRGCCGWDLLAAGGRSSLPGRAKGDALRRGGRGECGGGGASSQQKHKHVARTGGVGAPTLPAAAAKTTGTAERGTTLRRGGEERRGVIIIVVVMSSLSVIAVQ